jgi:glutamate dehydrogenase (NAD(P)+)
VPVVGLCDAQGVMANPDGLDVETLLLSRDPFGCVDRTRLRASDVELPREAWLRVEAEILVPAAMSYVISESNVDDVPARLVVEAANVATTAAAQEKLHARGVTLVPDFVANVAANAWWWWTLFADIEPEASDAFAKVSMTLGPLVAQVLERAEVDGVSPRAAATAISQERAAQLRTRH